MQRIPIFVSSPPTVALAGHLYYYVPLVLDPNNVGLLYSLDQAPAGMTIDPVYGIVTWTPASAQTQTVTIRATVNWGISPGGTPIPATYATQTYTIHVYTTLNSIVPQITSTSPDKVVLGETYHLSSEGRSQSA